MDVIEYIVDLQPYVVETIDFDLSEVKLVTIPPKTQQVEITPSVQKQVVEPELGKYIDKVTVKPVTAEIDANLKDYNIRKGKVILGVTGTLEPDKPDQVKEVVPSENEQVVRADNGFELVETIVKAIPKDYVGSAIPKEEQKTITPTTTDQVLYAGSFLDGDVTIKGDENLQAKYIAKGTRLFGVEGTAETATRDPNETMYEMQEADYMRYSLGHINRSDIPSEAEYLEQQEYVNSAIAIIMGEEF